MIIVEQCFSGNDLEGSQRLSFRVQGWEAFWKIIEIFKESHRRTIDGLLDHLIYFIDGFID